MTASGTSHDRGQRRSSRRAPKASDDALHTAAERREEPEPPPVEEAPPQIDVPARPDAARPDDEPPRMIGPYRVLKILGQGGMGSVYLAEQTDLLERKVAVKLIRASLTDRDAILRFASERRALARMHHPYIAHVFDAGVTPDSYPYIAMEYIPGLPISHYCRRKKATLARLLKLFITVAQGFAHAHQKGVIHRDIKPSNILVMEEQGRAIPKIIDFGIAKQDNSPMITEAGAVVGTLAYMSPEQIRGEKVDHRTDIFSYGVLLHELLTGRLPDATPTSDAAVEQDLWSQYPAPLRDIVRRCLEGLVDKRFEDFGELIEALEDLLERVKASERGTTLAESPEDEALGVELMREVWALFEASEEPTVTELLELLERAAESRALLSELVFEARRLDERRHRTLALEARRLRAAADCRLAFALAADHPARYEIFERAVEGFRRALDEGAAALEAGDFCHLGDALLELDDPMAAADAYRRAVELDDSLACAYYGLATASWPFEDELEEALNASWKVVDLDPQNALAHNNLGIVLFLSHSHPGISLFGKEKLAEAIAAFERAIELDPEQSIFFHNLGLALLLRGRREKALQVFHRAAEIENANEEPPIFRQIVEHPDAESFWTLLAKRTPEGILPYEPPDTDNLETATGLALARQDKLNEAREAFARSERRRNE